jgi:hypothetical protein
MNPFHSITRYSYKTQRIGDWTVAVMGDADGGQENVLS